MDIMEAVLQNNAVFFASDYLYIHVDRLRPPTGSGRTLVDGKCVSFDEFSVQKNSIYIVENRGNNCLAAALIVAIEYANNDHRRISLKKFNGRRGQNLLNDMAIDLCRRANVDLTHGGHYNHIVEFQNSLGEYTIVVYNKRDGSSVYFEGIRAHGKKCLNLIM